MVLNRADDCGGKPSKVEIIIVKDGYPLWRVKRAISDKSRMIDFGNIKPEKERDPLESPPFSDMK